MQLFVSTGAAAAGITAHHARQRPKGHRIKISEEGPLSSMACHHSLKVTLVVAHPLLSDDLGARPQRDNAMERRVTAGWRADGYRQPDPISAVARAQNPNQAWWWHDRPLLRPD